uniref:Uncharacterized protein n=1 Tax=viral metagenome TaxID=1070528 RepID=A0A6M3JP87_9ZZZZ
MTDKRVGDFITEYYSKLGKKSSPLKNLLRPLADEVMKSVLNNKYTTGLTGPFGPYGLVKMIIFLKDIENKPHPYPIQQPIIYFWWADSNFYIIPDTCCFFKGSTGVSLDMTKRNEFIELKRNMTIKELAEFVLSRVVADKLTR